MKYISDIFLNPNSHNCWKPLWVDMVRNKYNKTIRHLAIVHITSYEKYLKIQICMNTYLAIMHMYIWMNLDNWTTLVQTQQ